LKLKVIPIILAVVGSASLLFGGWFIYHSVAMENPLNQALNGSPGVVDYQAKVEGNKAVFQVNLSSQANLREIVHEINAKNTEVAGKRTTDIQVTSNTSPMLEEWWASALFGVAQAMETSKYGDIPLTLEAKAKDIPGLAVQTEMDDTNVYVRLTEGEHVKFVILPRSASKMGVWPNE
jgi:hypothetical protein